MFLIGSVYLLIAASMWLLLVPDPKEVGIEMQSEENAWFGGASAGRE